MTQRTNIENGGNGAMTFMLISISVIQKVEDSDIVDNFWRIRQEAEDIVKKVLGSIADDPEAI